MKLFFTTKVTKEDKIFYTRYYNSLFRVQKTFVLLFVSFVVKNKNQNKYSEMSISNLQFLNLHPNFLTILSQKNNEEGLSKKTRT